jgi:hypothetical protein
MFESKWFSSADVFQMSKNLKRHVRSKVTKFVGLCLNLVKIGGLGLV